MSMIIPTLTDLTLQYLFNTVPQCSYYSAYDIVQLPVCA